MNRIKKISIIISAAGIVFLMLSEYYPGNASNTIRNNYTSLFQDTTKFIQSWEKAIPHQDIPKNLWSNKAKDCGACHIDIYNEWKKSTHSHAWTDVQFQAEWKKNDKIFLCLNCHTPMENQLEYLTSAIIDGDYLKPIQQKNEKFDKELQKEGITCISCHQRDNTIIGTQGTNSPSHPVKTNASFLSESLCISCHNATSEVTHDLVCTFETGNEWKAGPYKKKGKNCISCHMPEIERSMVTGFPKRKGHRHYFPASGIPKSKDHFPERLESLEYFDVQIDEWYKARSKTEFTFKIKNAQAGHRVPTGDPERFLLIDFNYLSGTKIIKHDQFRVGEQWEWYPSAKKISDNNLNPGEEREFISRIKIPKLKELTLQITVTKHRMSQEAFDYHNFEDYPTNIIIYDKSYKINIRKK